MPIKITLEDRTCARNDANLLVDANTEPQPGPGLHRRPTSNRAGL
jgi:hypothetical protein